jgi:DNA-binding CsgD family transcriptional regulator/tetratricopeptide (TPR) repeat protein
MALEERDRELNLLSEVYGRCVKGSGQVAVISGPVSSGKTSLFQEFANRIPAGEALLVDAVASEGEQCTEFGVIDQLVQGIYGAIEGKGYLTGFAAGRLGESAVQSTSRSMQSLASREFHEYIMMISRKKPIIMYVDDAHFMDEASLQCMLYLVRRIKHLSVLVIFSECDCGMHGNMPLHVEIGSLSHYQRIPISPLSADAVIRHIARHTSTDVARRIGERCHQISGGNPMLVHALIRDYHRVEIEAPGRLVPNVEFRQGMLTCLHRCGTMAIKVARALAVVDEPAAAVRISALLQIDAMRVICVIGTLQDTGLLRNRRLHEQSRAAIMADMPAKVRQDLHARAAQLLYGAGSSAEVIACHLVEADGLVTFPWSIQVLREAAQQALAEGHVENSIVYLRHAADISEDDEEQLAIISALADAEWLLNPAISARSLQQLVLAVRDGLLDGEHGVSVLHHLMWHGRLGDVDDLIRVLQGQAHHASTPDCAVGDKGALQEISLFLLAYHPAAIGMSISEFCAEVTPSSISLCAAISFHSTLSNGRDQDISGAVDQILGTASQSRMTLAAMLFGIMTLVLTGDLDRAQDWCDVFCDESSVQHIPVRCALLATIRAEISLRRGDLPAARAYIRSALSLVPLSSWGIVAGIPLAIMTAAALGMGDLADARSYLNIPVPGEMFQTVFALRYLQSVGRFYLASGYYEQALDHFESCGDLARQLGLDYPEVVTWRTDCAEACYNLGQIARSRALAEEQLARSGHGRGRARGISLRHLAAVTSGDRSTVHLREAYLREAVIILDECGDKFELSQALAMLSTIQGTAERKELAPEPQRAAFVPEQQCNAKHLTDSPFTSDPMMGGVSTAGDESGVLVRSWPDPVLTDAEMRVAQLAASGYTNRQIAERLYITVSTVEQHLTRVYRKLKVGNRSDLRVHLRTH